MEFIEFKENIIRELENFYGKDAKVSADSVLGNNGERRERVSIIYNDSDRRTCPAIYLDNLYQDYCNGDKSVAQCMGTIVKLREQYEADDKIEDFAAGLLCWENVKNHIYPALISAVENTELLQNLVSGRFLDMAVIYIIRGDFGEKGNGHVKVSVSMLQQYGISEKELHDQAVVNLENDGYRFQSMENVLVSMILEDNALADKPVKSDTFETGKLYILSNSQRLWGAAGLLNEKLLKRELGNKSCFILPSSIHETIFVPVADNMCAEDMSRMVREVNETQVEVSERLSDHCYVWDGNSNRVRMCA